MKTTKKEELLIFPIGEIDQRELLGQNGQFIREIEEEFGVRIVARGDELRIFGRPRALIEVRELLKEITNYIKSGGHLSPDGFHYALKMFHEKGSEALHLDELDDRILITARQEIIRPRTEGQKTYIRAILENDIVFSIGPAGTGKTYLAVAMAIRALKMRAIERIVLVRPAVEADESLGFLPGDMREKVDPYLRPLYDAIYDMIPDVKVERLIAQRTIEIAPLAYMRGRTLNNSYIILDEAQNSTYRQMKMFLTRLGFNSKAIVTGDITQIDLKNKEDSGLVQVQHILKGIQGIAFVYLSELDVVRHPLVMEIVKAYEEYEVSRKSKEKKKSEGEG